MAQSVDISRLEGWLIKEKSAKAKWTIAGESNKRWFRVQMIQSSDELALCYFSNKSSKQPRGWVFLADVMEVREETRGEGALPAPNRAAGTQRTQQYTHHARTSHIRAKAKPP